MIFFQKKGCTDFLFFVLICCQISAGRWANFDDASVQGEYQIETHIDKNGNVNDFVQEKYKILNEQGRLDFAEYIISYSEDVEKVDLKKVEIETDGSCYPIYQWENKPVASADFLFERRRQIKIALPKIKVGSVITLDYMKEHRAKDLPGYVGIGLIPAPCLIKSYQHKIHSDIPLMVQMNDPIHILSMESKRHGSKQEITLKAKRSFVRFPVAENFLSVSFDQYPMVLLCSEKSWVDLSQRITPLYEKVISETLPVRFQEIADNASKQKEEKDQINAVTTSLIDHITYVSISSIGQRLAPHSLKKINEMGRGDCKDYSVSTVAILRSMGYKAFVALVKRGEGLRGIDTGMGFAGAFNHAMVKVLSKNSDRVYWIDPTNIVSMADGLFPDIQGKKALVLGVKNGGIEKIPENDPSHSMRFLSRDVQVNFQDGHSRCIGFLDLKGEAAISFCEASVQLPYQQRKESFYRLLGGGRLDERDFSRMDMPDFSGRTVQNVRIGFDYRSKDACHKTNMGLAINCGSLNHIHPVLFVLKNQIGDLFLGAPRTVQTRSVVRNVTVDNASAANLYINSPWFLIERKVISQGNDIVVEMKTVNKVSWISRKDMQSEKYKQLEKTLGMEDTFKLIIKPIALQSDSKPT